CTLPGRKCRGCSLGDEIRIDQPLPLPDRKADVADEEIVLRRSNSPEWPLSDLQADIARGRSQ
ncbi:MAG: hypothetical protein V3V34_01240, partial [Kiloniellales bacterium]